MIDDNNLDPEEDDVLNEEDCPYSHIFMSLLTMSKPIGFIWEDIDIIENFLKKRGYKIIERTNSKGNNIKIAVKPSDSCIPNDEFSNLREVFNQDVQNIILSWLLKIGGEN